MTALTLFLALVAGELRVDTDVVERAGQDRHDDRAGTRAAHPVVEIAALPSSDEPDDQPDHQDDGAESHVASTFLCGIG